MVQVLPLHSSHQVEAPHMPGTQPDWEGLCMHALLRFLLSLKQAEETAHASVLPGVPVHQACKTVFTCQ